MAVSVGQITIMDFNDAVTLTGYLSSNHTKSIKYDGNNEIYSPNFPTTNLVITPSLFKAGSATDIMASGTNIKTVTWHRKSNIQSTESALASGETMGAAFPKALTVKTQPFSATVFSVEYICTIVYTDPTTGLDLVYKNSITFNKVTDGNNVALAEITANPGFAFKNKLPTTTKLTAHLYRGASKDTTNLTYIWEKLAGSTWTPISGATTVDYTVTQASVDSMQQYRVKITDTVVGDTYYSDIVTVLDFNDPIMVVVKSSSGEIFKNGIVATTLTAQMFQNGEEIDITGTGYTYTWSKVDKDGTAVAFGTGKTKAVGSSDVSARATFICTVS